MINELDPAGLDGSPGMQLATYAAESRLSDLPAEVVDRTKLLVFDEFGCELVGREMPAGQLIVRYARQFHGIAESTVIGSTERVPAALAALANGTAGHADEIDAPHATSDFRGTGHPACVVVPAVVAMSERSSRTGAELVNAVALGYDVGSRAISAVDGIRSLTARHGLYGGAFHALGAAVGCARLIGLEPQQHLFSAALALAQSVSLNAFFGERRHMSKAFVEGQAALAGVSGAMLAADGFEASDNVFDDPKGFLATWGAEDRADHLTKDLGSDYAIMGVNFKFYSAGYPIHSAVEGALSLQEEHGITVDAIERITVDMPGFAGSVVNDRQMPSISLQTMLSVALVAGRLGFDEAHSTLLLGDPRTKRLKDLTEVVLDGELEREQPRGRGSRVTIQTRDGEQVTTKVEHPRGHRFRTPAPTWDDLREKWEPMLLPRIGASRFDQLYDVCRSLESVDNVREVTALLGQESSPVTPAGIEDGR